MMPGLFRNVDCGLGGLDGFPQMDAVSGADRGSLQELHARALAELELRLQ